MASNWKPIATPIVLMNPVESAVDPLGYIEQNLSLLEGRTQ